MDTMTKARVQLIEAQPFYGTFLQNCVFSWNPAIKTAAVGVDKFGNIRLMIGPEFWGSLSEEHRVGLLMHEMLHLLLKHLDRGTDLDRHIANIAMDIALNQYIPLELLPPGALLPEAYDLQPLMSFEFYYKHLMEDAKKKKKAESSKTTDNHEGIGEISNEAGTGDPGISEALSSTNQGVGPELEQAIINKAISSATRAVGRGSLPYHLQKVLEAERNQSAVKWKTILRRFVGRSLSSEIESTRTCPNRRLGIGAMGSKRKESPVVLIAADNSGSMSAADISQVMNEVRSILKSVSEKTEVLYFDTTIAHIEKLTRLTEVKRYANGGTDFTCVMKYANEKRADVLIMLTDGDGGMKVKPKCPVIWVMPKGSQALSYPGMKVQL